MCFFCCSIVEYFAQFWGPFEHVFAILDDMGKSVTHAMKVTAQVCSVCVYTFVYVCVCVCVCMYVCMCVWMYVRVYVWMYVWVGYTGTIPFQPELPFLYIQKV